MSGAVSELCNQFVISALVNPLPGKDLGMWPAAMAGMPLREVEAEPLDLLPKAARGDREAQSELAMIALYSALGLAEAEKADAVIVLSEGLMFARMAAMHGDPDDAWLAITMLSLGSILTAGHVAHDFAAEAIARLELLADAGGELGEGASRILIQCADHEAPETLELAKAYRSRLAAAGKDV